MSTDSDIDRFVELLDSIEGFDPGTRDRTRRPTDLVGVAARLDRCETFDVARAMEHEEEPRQERLEELVRLEAKVSEAAEAAADAAAHAVEATKAAEAASVARAAKKAKSAETAKAAAKKAATAVGKAGKAAKAAEAASAASTETAFNVPPPSESSEARQDSGHVLELRLADDELEQIVRLADEKDVPVPDLVRSLLISAIGRSDDN